MHPPMPMPTPRPTPMPMPMPMPMRRLRAALMLAMFFGAVALVVALSGRDAAAQSRAANDMDNAKILLEAMRGTGPVACAFAMGTVEGNGNWGRWNGAGEDSQSDALRDWLEHGLTDPAVVPMLRSALGPGDACVRQTAARLLGRSHNVTAVRALVESLRDPDPSTRDLAALGLGISGDPAGFDPLVGALRDTAAKVRATSAESLGRLGDRRAVDRLVPLLSRDPAPEVRRAAAYALGEMN